MRRPRFSRREGVSSGDGRYSELLQWPIEGVTMWLDVIALLVLGFFVGQGAFRGGFVTGLGLLALVLAYAAAIYSAPRIGPGLAHELGLPELLGVPLAGTAAFLVVYVGVGMVGGVLKRTRSIAGARMGAGSRMLGGVFGAVRGGLVVLLLSWLAIWVDALRVTGVVESVPSIRGSVAANVTEATVEGAVRVAFADRGSAGILAARIAARPGASLSTIQSIVENPRLETLRSDELFWTHVTNGSVDAAVNRPSFIDLTFDNELRSELAALGLLGSDETDPGAFLDFAREALRDVGPRLQGLREDQQFKKLLDNPEVLAMVQGGDTMGLLANKDFRSLVMRLAADESD